MWTEALDLGGAQVIVSVAPLFWLCELDFRHSTVEAVRGAQITLSESLEHPQKVSRAK